jgi:hypothetical protein
MWHVIKHQEKKQYVFVKCDICVSCEFYAQRNLWIHAVAFL